MAMSTSTCQGLKLTCLLLHGASRQPMLVLVPVGSTKGPQPMIGIRIGVYLG